MFYQFHDMDPLAFLNDLNVEQRKAVEYCDSSQLVLSGAGSGKTRVLTYKIAYLIQKMKIPSYSILALTFTNKAANEMKQRISKLIGAELVKNINMGTFHSIFCKILRINISYFPGKKYKSDFQIIDEEDTKKIIKELLETEFEGVLQRLIEERDLNDNNKILSFTNDLIKKITDKISLLKNRAITYEDYFSLSNEIEKDKKNGIEFLKNIYEVYVKTCQRKNVMDFDDLLLNTFILFNNPDNIGILKMYQNKFEYILVDEFQDTNHVQFEILKALSWKNKKICGVGDDYQSIYSFRGADINNFNTFIEIFKDSKIFKLNRNYRSTSNIVKVANKLILNNKKQFKKDLYSNINEIDGKVKILINKNSFDECDKITFIIKELIKNHKCEYGDIAVLYRMNSQSNYFIKTFFNSNIPHKLCNRIGFFETSIIKNILSYLNFIINPNLDICLKRIIDYPPRGIGKKTIDKIFSRAKRNHVSGWEIIKNCDNDDKKEEYDIDNDLKKKLLPFKNLIENLMSLQDTKRVFGVVSELIEMIKLKEYLKKNNSDSIEKINILLDKINEMEEEHINNNFEKYTLNGFLEETSLLLGNEERYEKKNSINENKVMLMTIHQAKGLEFKYVFIVGLEEGFYPVSLSFTEEEIEEERRILYVAITRAKVNCYLSYANNRKKGEEELKRTVSRFIDEIKDSDLVQVYSPPNYEEYKNQQFIIRNKERKNNQNNYNNENNNINNNYNNIYNNNINNNDNNIYNNKYNYNNEEIPKKKSIEIIKKEKKDKSNEKEKIKKNKNNNNKKKSEVKDEIIENKDNENIINNNFICCRENDFVVIDQNEKNNNIEEREKHSNNQDKKTKKKDIKKKKKENNEEKEEMDNNEKNIKNNNNKKNEKKKKNKDEDNLINDEIKELDKNNKNENNKKDNKFLNKKRDKINYNIKLLESFIKFK